MNIIQFAQLNCTSDSSTLPLMKSCLCVYMCGWCIELSSLSSYPFQTQRKGYFSKLLKAVVLSLSDQQCRMLHFISISIKLQLPTYPFLKSFILFPCCMKSKNLSVDTNSVFSGTVVRTLKSQIKIRSFYFPIF